MCEKWWTVYILSAIYFITNIHKTKLVNNKQTNELNAKQEHNINSYYKFSCASAMFAFRNQRQQQTRRDVDNIILFFNISLISSQVTLYVTWRALTLTHDAH